MLYLPDERSFGLRRSKNEILLLDQTHDEYVPYQGRKECVNCEGQYSTEYMNFQKMEMGNAILEYRKICSI